MTDYMIRATAADGLIRAFAITAGDTVEEARKRHDTSPVVTAALGRMLSGAAMMSMTMKDDADLLTLQVKGNGPMQGITVTASPTGILKGFANVNQVDVPPKYKGKLDVGAAVGNGILRVMKDTGGREPYVGTVKLVSGEIAEDLTYYFAQSEQTPSVVGLGVLVGTDLSVSCAGGFIAQLMPDATEAVITKLEENIKTLPSVTEMLENGSDPEGMLQVLLKDLSPKVLEKRDVAYKCDCGRNRIIRSLSSLKPEDLDEMINEGEPVEVTCHFCNERYVFSVDEIKTLREGLDRGK